MNYDQTIGALGVYDHFMAFLIGTPRLFMIIQVVPFMGNNIVTGQLRVVVVFSFYLLLSPALIAQLPHIPEVDPSLLPRILAIVVKEAFIGFILGYLGSMVFWMIESVGLFIDNQRGAAMAAQTDPLSGSQTSPLGSFLFQCLVYIFFTSGAFVTFLTLIYKTYEFWPPHEFIPMNWKMRLPELIIKQVDWLMTYMMLLAGPIAVACLLTDVSLGLVNRFASQLNVYVLAMPIKSAVAAFLLIFYFKLLLEKAVLLFKPFETVLFQIKAFLQ